MNVGDTALENVVASVVPGGSGFSIGSDSCSGPELAARASCEVEIRFTPVKAGASNATLVMSADSGGTARVPLAALATAHLRVVLDETWCTGMVSAPNLTIRCGDTCDADVFGDVELTAQSTDQPSRPCYFDGWSEAGCSGTGACSVPMATDQVIHASFSPGACVDPINGDDDGPGTCARPFRTLTHALTSPAQGGDVVQLKAGTYSAASGEQFPIRIPPEIQIIGDEVNKGDAVDRAVDIVDDRTNCFALVDGADVTIAGIRFDCPGATSSSAIYVVRMSGVSIRNNTIAQSSGFGMLLFGSTGLVVTGNRITNTLEGISIADSSVLIEDNEISSNGEGVVVNVSPSLTVDLGGGALGSRGRNLIRCNSMYNLALLGAGTTVFAKQNIWNHAPPTEDLNPSCDFLATPYDICRQSPDLPLDVTSPLSPLPTACP